MAETAQISIEEKGVRAWPQVVRRILAFVAGAIFVYAGVIKLFDPLRFASDITNYQILPGRGAARFFPSLAGTLVRIGAHFSPALSRCRRSYGRNDVHFYRCLDRCQNAWDRCFLRLFWKCEQQPQFHLPSCARFLPARSSAHSLVLAFSGHSLGREPTAAFPVRPAQR
jgi:Methylamine utilisation protein MauE